MRITEQPTWEEDLKSSSPTISIYKALFAKASAPTHSEGAGRWLSLARIPAAGLVQTKGLDVRLCSLM